MLWFECNPEDLFWILGPHGDTIEVVGSLRGRPW